MATNAETLTAVPSPGLDGLLHDIQILEGLVDQWDDQQQMTIKAYRNAVDALNRETLARLIRSLKGEPAALKVLKEALNDEVVYAVLRYHELVKPSLHERLEDALDSVRPYLATHGGNVEVVRLDMPDCVTIRLLGSCDGCPAAGLTLSDGVEKAIKEYCPEITSIVKAKGSIANAVDGEQTLHFVSPFANSSDSGWVLATLIKDIPEGDLTCLDVAGHSLLFSRFENKVTCFENACAHLGMPLDTGTVANRILTCPHHGFEFSLESGECLTVPEVQLNTHAVRVVDDKVEIKFS